MPLTATRAFLMMPGKNSRAVAAPSCREISTQSRRPGLREQTWNRVEMVAEAGTESGPVGHGAIGAPQG